jgi:hypothetical protein
MEDAMVPGTKERACGAFSFLPLSIGKAAPGAIIANIENNQASIRATGSGKTPKDVLNRLGERAKGMRQP